MAKRGLDSFSERESMPSQTAAKSMDPEKLLDAFPKAFVEIGPKEQDVAIALYRLLALGQPVTHQQLANAGALPVDAVDELLRDWLGVYHDSDGKVSGFLGLAVGETSHKMQIDGREVFAWCAWDTLFLPALIGRGARIISHCAQSGQEIRLGIEDGRITAAGPETTVLSFVVPDETGIRRDVINSFCQSVLFFASVEEGEQWVARHPGTFLMSLESAFELAQLFNRRKFPGLMDQGRFS